ncbi:DUF421 domain-containing protein [Moellerella wisconsensis]|uniref:DUF421 domain-containing protein n=1 Tax=Moellerella wisconsensis TaxID=158849 RepID=A0ACD3Y5G2_9GAMM|nr:YetF domain-containing protein [Moellerella wisconsensis]KLN96246.1 membrane protein [Moellerella wisconsensis]UNH26726.1 DUF421 domain-containing protein [Moellerella wisconsensis]UNH38368.1 DUF421 domain-containing protein [Moellerella wisconsensis]UNH41883.1 DUF421 domain-containing protein [Moellerella wisconsensis]WJW81352.1 DUF421 domain-containing protein [Moellerella wisconsensis]
MTYYYALVIVKFFIGFTIVITHMNLSGKTQLSQMTPIDFIGNFVLGGIIGGVIYSDSIPLHQYIILLFIGVIFISLLNYLTKKFNFFRSVTIGDPIPIIKNGNFLMDNILEKSNKIDILNLISRLHAQGIHAFQEIYYAQIEPDGQLTVICDKSKMPSVILMKDGEIRVAALDKIGKDKEWIQQQIKQHNIQKIEDIFLAEYWNDKVSFILTDGKINRTNEE